MMKLSVKPPRILCLSILLVLFTSCSKRGVREIHGWTPLPGPFHNLREIPGTVFDVTYTPKTVRIDLETVRRTLLSVSTNGDVFVFDDSDPRLRSLGRGR
jgi:hypothetical protein